MREIDARLALIRHALSEDAKPPRVSPLQRRASVAAKMAAAVEAEYPITEECRESYDYDFAERVGIKMDSDLRELCDSKSVNPDCCSYHSTLLEVGCVEFYDWQRRFPFDASLLKPIPTPAPVGLCSRCESVGHMVECCPFSAGDADVMRIARERRERRARKAAAA